MVEQVDPTDSDKDRNRARFTLEEMQEVLQDRHELKTKFFFIKEELKYYKWYDFLITMKIWKHLVIENVFMY